MAKYRPSESTSSIILIVVVMLAWGFNWPVLKLGVTEIAPLTFRLYTLPFAGIGLLALSKISGDSIQVPRGLWPIVIVLALFNITGWNGLVLFGVKQMPVGRSVVLGFTMPVWATLVSLMVLHEPLSRRKIIGLLLGMGGIIVLVFNDLTVIEGNPFGVLMILAAAISWAFGTVLLRKFRPAIPQNTLTGWMMVVGCAPLVVVAPLLDSGWLSIPKNMSGTAWFAVLYNIVVAGTIAHGAWFRLARTLPVAVSSLSSLPIPIVGVIAGMIVFGERPGRTEWIAFALVLSALAVVLWPSQAPDTSSASPREGSP